MKKSILAIVLLLVFLPVLAFAEEDTGHVYDRCNNGRGWSEPGEGYKCNNEDCCGWYQNAHIHDLGKVWENEEVEIAFTPGFEIDCEGTANVYYSEDGEDWEEIYSEDTVTVKVNEEDPEACWKDYKDWAKYHNEPIEEECPNFFGANWEIHVIREEIDEPFRYIKVEVAGCHNDYSSAWLTNYPRPGFDVAQIEDSDWESIVLDTDCGKGGCGGRPDPEQCHFSYNDDELIVHNGNYNNGGKCLAYTEADLSEYDNIENISLSYDVYSGWVGGTCYIRSGVGIFEDVNCPSENQILEISKYNLDACDRLPETGYTSEEIDFTEEWIDAGKPNKILIGAWVSSCSNYFGKIHLKNVELNIENSEGDEDSFGIYPIVEEIKEPPKITGSAIGGSGENVFEAIVNFFKGLFGLN